MIPYVRFEEIASRWLGKKIVVIGDLILDRYRNGVVERICTEAPVPILRSSGAHSPCYLGGAANVAHNLSVLGLATHLIGIVGKDRDGKFLKDMAVRHKIDTSGVYEDDCRPTTVKERFVSGNHMFLRYDIECTDEIGSSASQFLEEAIYKSAAESLPSAFIFSDYARGDYTKGVCTEDFLNTVFVYAQEKQIPVCVDPTVKNLRTFKRASLIKPNKREMEKATGLLINDTPDSYARLAARLGKDFDCPFIVTLGDKGSLICDKGSARVIETEVLEVFDVAGAGDTSMAAIVAAMVGGATLDEAAHLGNLASGVVVRKFGTATCSIEELTGEIRRRTA